MRLFHVACALMLALVWTSCSSTRWVHPYKKEDQLTADWNLCEREYLNNMATNPGTAIYSQNQTGTRLRIAQCLKKKGWRQIEDD